MLSRLIRPSRFIQPLQRRMSTNTQVHEWGGFPISDRIKGEVHKTDVWSVFSPASGFMPKDSINLGQGFMNWAPPAFVQQAAQNAITNVDTNHYSLAKCVSYSAPYTITHDAIEVGSACVKPFPSFTVCHHDLEPDCTLYLMRMRSSFLQTHLGPKHRNRHHIGC